MMYIWSLRERGIMMPTIDNTKRRFSITVVTKVGATMKALGQFSCAEIDNFRKLIKEKRPVEIIMSPTTVVLLPADIIGWLMIEEILVDKLKGKESTILVN